MIDLYKLALKTHVGLTPEDIDYASTKLSSCGVDTLLHVHRNNYIGLFSPKYNQQIDNLIKLRSPKLCTLSVHLDMEILNPQERREFEFLEQVLLSVLKNTIEYLRVFQPREIGNLSEIFKIMLINICEELKIPKERFDLVLKVAGSREVGTLLKISHNNLVQLEKLLLDPEKLTPDLKERYQKEIKILSQK